MLQTGNWAKFDFSHTKESTNETSKLRNLQSSDESLHIRRHLIHFIDQKSTHGENIEAKFSLYHLLKSLRFHVGWNSWTSKAWIVEWEENKNPQTSSKCQIKSVSDFDVVVCILYEWNGRAKISLKQKKGKKSKAKISCVDSATVTHIHSKKSKF